MSIQHGKDGYVATQIAPGNTDRRWPHACDMASNRFRWQTRAVASVNRSVRPLAGAVASIALFACTMRHEQEPGNSAKQLEPAVMSRGDAGEPESVYLSALLEFEGNEVRIVKLDRVQGALRKRRGLRQRRGLLVIATDPSGKPLHREVIQDPRSRAHEYVSDGGVLKRAAPTKGPEYAVVRVPLAAHRLSIHDARSGATDGEPLTADPRQPSEPAAPSVHPLIASFELGVH